VLIRSTQGEMDDKEDITRFTNVDKTNDPSFFISFLDAGNALEDVKAIKRAMVDYLELREGLSVLDVGCGTGDDARELAQLVSPSGRVIGVDNSSAMIAEARKRVASSQRSVEFIEGDAQNLNFADATFDRCRTERMLMHLDDPKKALAEMVRVVRRGGRVAVFDFDWDGMFVDSPYKETTHRIVRMISDGIRQGWIGRVLPRLFREAGLTQVVSLPCAVRVHYAFLHRLLDGHLAKAQTAGMLSGEELATWWTHLEKAEGEGQFNAGIFGFVVGGRKG
jgi:ubiquinone/menaquinone biosynthesis C-methylase UbiE